MKFDVIEIGVIVFGDQLVDNVFLGCNILCVMAYNKVIQVIFEYDISGFKIYILDVDCNIMMVSGYVVDFGGIESVSLDGLLVVLESDNSFLVVFINKLFNLFIVIDGYGYESSIEFVCKDQEFNGIVV